MRTLETPHTAAGPALRELIVGSRGDPGGDPRRHRAGPPGAGRAPLRGLDRRGLRVRRGDRPRARPGAGPARRDPRLRRGGDLGLADHAGPARPDRRALRPLPRPAPPRRRLPDDRRPRGRRGVGRPAPRPGGARAARRRRRLPRPVGGALLGARPLPGPLPARHADGDGGDGRDPGDLAHLVAAAGLHRSVGAAIRDSLARQGTPGLVFCHLSHAYADGASLYFTFISRARSGAEIEQWRQVKRPPREAIVAAGGDDHPPPRGRRRPRPLHGGGGRPHRRRRAAGAEGGARPGRDHEPRQADPSRAASLRRLRRSGR